MRSLAFSVSISVLCLAAAGCSNKTNQGDMKQAITDYNQGQYGKSRDSANQAMSATNGPAKDDAAYLAGLSAYQLGDRDEAERRWLAAADSPNEETAASSKAMLG